jgi:hypothetical protein
MDSIDNNTGKATLVEAFGTEIGSKLFGAAVKLSARYNVDLDDFIQDVAEAATEVQTEYGFVHVNTAINRAKNAIFASYRYGVNRYYGEQGVTEFSYDATTAPEYITDHRAKATPGDSDDHNSDDDTERTLLDIQGGTFTNYCVVAENLSDAFLASYATLSNEDRVIMVALSEGWQAQEIAREIGKSGAYISNAKKRLRETFAWAA